MVNDVSVIGSDYAFLYSTFELQAHGKINVPSKDIIWITNRVSKVSVKPKIKIFKKNAEIILEKGEQPFAAFDEIVASKSFASTYTVPDDDLYFLFNCSGVKPLNNGHTVSLTPKSEIRRYRFGYLIGRLVPYIQRELTGESLLLDILAHYKRTESFEKSFFTSCSLSDIASLYLNKCEESGLINSVAKQFIKEGRL